MSLRAAKGSHRLTMTPATNGLSTNNMPPPKDRKGWYSVSEYTPFSHTNGDTLPKSIPPLGGSTLVNATEDKVETLPNAVDFLEIFTSVFNRTKSGALVHGL
uniref:Uncharacterized protein n=1 Tax=Odontella aurita TaxID=265563 RepID=A0A7S4JUK7_9STRA|mmetsp:Transcript_54319/g.162519  ORF Transcript_54319/g.162519 Transcript_54319/m.162519 type:complete len:102 (+) Transcript_54319:1368-1673(+)|eukprot:CAMPEP_0113547386 /NCGR_PEP_ID=MMETSP0015_2-20120614/12326_1 /TAXON_ID=2838 /ORGANISM="Odontella" /LENGTH=101 /DNA_ID=CAMNT_0000447933 /DNA_START=1287 /DNA_END=1592 /DNA_ORIENTATION=- /assembly_acc=CAM_ASM_000160